MDGQAETAEMADVIALVSAHCRRDEDGCQALLDQLGPEVGVRTMSQAISLLIDVASRLLPGGRRELAEMLVAWQRSR